MLPQKIAKYNRLLAKDINEVENRKKKQLYLY